jgi:hypothetical protein
VSSVMPARSLSGDGERDPTLAEADAAVVEDAGGSMWDD